MKIKTNFSQKLNEQINVHRFCDLRRASILFFIEFRIKKDPYVFNHNFSETTTVTEN